MKYSFEPNAAKPHRSRRRFLTGGAGLAGLLVWPAARACEFDALYMRVIHPWTCATPPGATTAVLYMSFDDVTRDDRLVGVETPVAEGAEAVGVPAAEGLDLPVPAGRPSAFAEDGPHVRLTGLRLPLQVGREYPLNLHFRESGTVRARLSVDFSAAMRFAVPLSLPRRGAGTGIRP